MGYKEDITEVINRVLGTQLQSVKLGPGVVGRNSSIAWALQAVMFVGVIAGAILHSAWLVGISLLGSIISGLSVAGMNVKFGKDNPAAALLEGSHFLQYQQMQAVATKGQIAELAFDPPVEPPVVLASAEKKQLPADKESEE